MNDQTQDGTLEVSIHVAHESANNIEGAEVFMGGFKWIVPALNFKKIRQLESKLAKLAHAPTAVSSMPDLSDVIEVVHAAMQRNYPKLSVGHLEELIDLSNAPRVIACVMGQSGLVPSGQGEAAASH